MKNTGAIRKIAMKTAAVMSALVIGTGAALTIPLNKTDSGGGFSITASASSTYVVTTSAGLNIRSGPGTGYKKVGAVPYNKTIEVYSISGGWAYMKYGNTTGYVSSSYIKQQSAPTPSTTTYYVTASSSLRLRAQASTNSATLANMPSGCAVQVASISNGWARIVNYNGKSGYASSSYLSQNKPNSKTNLSYAMYKNSGARITCGFDGYTTTKGRHEGIDVKLGNGKQIYSVLDGTVVRVAKGYSGTNGLSTIAIYNSTYNKTIIYLHANPGNLYAGQYISKGQQIGTEGWRGCSNSSGSHTHIEVRNGKQGYAAKSLNDYKLENSNPASFFNSIGYNVK